MAAVDRFFLQFEGKDAPLKGIYKRYRGVEEFEEAVFHDLDAVLHRFLAGEHPRLVETAVLSIRPVPSGPRHPSPPRLSISYQTGRMPEKNYRTAEGQTEVKVGVEEEEPLDLDLHGDPELLSPHLLLSYELSDWWANRAQPDAVTRVNGKPLVDAVKLLPGDVLELGRSRLSIRFQPRNRSGDAGVLQETATLDEMAAVSLAEDDLLEVFSRISGIAATTIEPTLRASRLLQEILAAFPIAERASILLIDGKELLPVASWPPGQASVSFTIAQRAIRQQSTSLWAPRQFTETGEPIPRSFQGTTSALYAPMVDGQQAIGLLHLDTTAPDHGFALRDVHLLRVIAQIAGPILLPVRQGTLQQMVAVYLSYSWRDREPAGHLASDLRRRRVRVYLDERRRRGAAWRDQLTVAVRSAQAFLCLASPDSVTDEDVAFELSVAVQADKPLFPLLLRPCTLPEPLNRTPSLSISGGEGIEELVQLLHELR
jgi:hypothetical protein